MENFKTIIFPSVFERHNSELDKVADNLLDGLKIFLNGEAYIIGNLAFSEGLNPHRTINSSPDDLDYNLFLYAALLLIDNQENRPVYLTTGFPFSTYRINKELAEKIIKGKHIIDYDASTFSDKMKLSKEVNVAKVDILPELQGSILGLRKGKKKVSGNFFIVSIGYGTFEAALSTPSGIVQRTAVSTKGIVYAIDMLIKELEKSYYLGLKTKQQIDNFFQRDYIILNRKRIDIRKMKSEVLNSYYENVISPELRTAFTDIDFAKANKMYITGGGALYPDLIDNFYTEFGEIVDIEVVENPLTLASEGFFLNSLEKKDVLEIPVGLDIGNSNTVLTVSDVKI